MPAHVHAQNMVLYAQDALETDKPGGRWESRRDGKDEWVEQEHSPLWRTDFNYRRKPRKILVNGIEVPAPEEKELKYDTKYWIPEPTKSDRLRLVDEFQWVDDDTDRAWLAAGIVHLTQEAAQAHAEAMLKHTKV